MRYYHTGARLLSFRRGARSISYLMFALAGFISLFTVSPIIDGATSPTIGVIWAFCLGVGGLSGLVSVVTDYWFYEYVGLPLMIASFVVLGLAAFTSYSDGGPVFLSSGFIASGIATHLFYRLWELNDSIHHSKQV